MGAELQARHPGRAVAETDERVEGGTEEGLRQPDRVEPEPIEIVHHGSQVIDRQRRPAAHRYADAHLHGHRFARRRARPSPPSRVRVSSVRRGRQADPGGYGRPLVGYGEDIYTEPEGDPDTLANLGPLRRWPASGRGRRAPTQHPVADGTGARRVRRALRAGADRPSDERAAALLRPALPHPHHQAGRGRDVPRPGRATGCGSPPPQRVTLTLGIPRAQVLLAGRARPSPTPPSSSCTPTLGSEELRHPVEPVPRRRLPHAQLPDPRHDPRRRHVVVRGGGRHADPGPGRAVPPHRPQHAPPRSLRPGSTRSRSRPAWGRAPWRRTAASAWDLCATRSWSASDRTVDTPSISRSVPRSPSLQCSGAVPRPAA